MLAALEAINLGDHPTAQLVLLGDYIDRGPHSAEVLYAIKELADTFPGRVVALLGNHEVDFLDWLGGDDEDVFWLPQDADLITVRSFLDPDEQRKVLGSDTELPTDFDELCNVNRAVKQAIKAKHSELIAWVRRLPLHYETDEQIFVHAGVDEEFGDSWLLETPDLSFTHKFPASMGPFYKTIVAGHVGTWGMHADGSHGIFFDGESHYYLDGSVGKTGALNVLKYRTDTERYEYLSFTGEML